MARAILRLGVLAVVACTLAGCAGGPDISDDLAERPPAHGVREPATPLQCVAYARAHSGVALHGDAYTWWNQAAGRYARGSSPKQGAVLVLTGYAGPNRAHLAVVRELVSDREIRIDHANWLDDGAIYEDDPVVDVSQSNDWSKVRVWNLRASAWGSRIYPVQGFIGPGPEEGSERISSIGDLITRTAGP
jgi:hypothetical protein